MSKKKLMHKGRVLVDNTESRKKELGDFIDHVVKTKKLNSADALKWRGRMPFTSDQLFGRVAKTCLAKVTHHAYRSGGTDASESLISSLVLFFLAQKPRLVSLSLSRTWTVFIDASYEHDEAGVPTAGFGGVLVSPSGKPTSFFSFELSGKDLEKLNPTAKKTAIFQCEFFAVLVALNLWQQQLTNRQVVFYVDNDGVRDVLISCSTSDPVGHALLIKTLELEGALALSSWFTRVPSKSNIADDPSRGECEKLIAAEVQRDSVDPMSMLLQLGPVS